MMFMILHIKIVSIFYRLYLPKDCRHLSTYIPCAKMMVASSFDPIIIILNHFLPYLNHINYYYHYCYSMLDTTFTMKIRDLEGLTLKHQNSLKEVTTAVQHIDLSNKQLKGDDSDHM